MPAIDDGASLERKFLGFHDKLGGTLPDGRVHKTSTFIFLAHMIHFLVDVPN